MQKYVAFVERPPKSGEATRYTVMAVGERDTHTDIERSIADYINEKRVKPLAAGLTSYMVVITDDVRSAANLARDAGLLYKSPDDILRDKAALANAQKFPPKPTGQEELEELRRMADVMQDPEIDPFEIFGIRNPFSPK